MEKEFNSLRAQLEPVLVNFRQSGMGDCGTEDDRHHNSLHVYSSRFSSFCVGKPLILYLYELLIREQNLLASFTTEMPTATSHTSETQRNITQGLEPKRKARAKRKSSADDTSELAQVLRTPVRIELSQEEKALQSAKYAKMRYSAMRAKGDLRCQLEKELESAYEVMAKFQTNNQEVPPYFKNKEQKLLKQLLDLEAETDLPAQMAMTSTASSTIPSSERSFAQEEEEEEHQTTEKESAQNDAINLE